MRKVLMPFLGETFALAAAVFWSANSVVLTEATVRIGSVSVNVTRMFFAALLLLITIWILGYTLELSTGQYTDLVISGILGLVLGDTFLFMSLQKIGARLAMLMMSLAPAISSILAYFFLDEILSTLHIIGIIITSAGIALVILQRGKKKPELSLNLPGVLFGVLAAAGQGAGLIFAKFAFNEGNGINGLTASLIRIISATIILYIFARFTGKLRNPVRMFRDDKTAFKNVIWAAILGPYLGITASMGAIAYTYVGVASTIMATVPILMLPIAKYYYKEHLSWKSVTGAFLAVGGVAILFLK